MAEIFGDVPLNRVEWQQYLLVISKYYQLASCIILLYDHLLTLDLEVEKVWKDFSRSRLILPNLLFTLNRYFPLISYTWIIIAYHQTSWSTSSCDAFLHFPLVMCVISDSVICGIVILRLYAMYSFKKQVLVSLSALAIVQIAFECWAASSVTLLDTPSPSGCIITVKDDNYYVFGLLLAWSVVFDSTACFMTLWKSLQSRYSRKGISLPLIDLFVRDGIIYFVVMFAAKVVNFVVFWTVSRDLITINWTFNHTITVIMISRLFLNVRAVENVVIYSSESDE